MPPVPFLCRALALQFRHLRKTTGDFGEVHIVRRLRRARGPRNGPNAAKGQTEKNSVRAYVFRFTLELGHCSMHSACLKGVNRVVFAIRRLFLVYPQ
jgi:hypothetical protein